jgi:hypothetical protein
MSSMVQFAKYINAPIVAKYGVLSPYFARPFLDHLLDHHGYQIGTTSNMR